MEKIIERMQNENGGVTVRTVKAFMSKVPSVFTGADLITWIVKNLDVEDVTEALHLAHLISSHGYLFPIDDHNLTVKNDGTFYRYVHDDIDAFIWAHRRKFTFFRCTLFVDFKRPTSGHPIVGSQKILTTPYIYANVRCRIRHV